MFLGLGKWTEKDITDEFGTDDELAALVAIVVPQDSSIPVSEIVPSSMDMDDLIFDAFKVEGISLQEELSKLPRLTPRDWQPVIPDQAHLGEHGYANCCQISLADAIAIADKWGAAVKS